MPAYGTVIVLMAFIIPHWHHGLFWASRIWLEAEKCKNYWWANILGISNLIKVDNQVITIIQQYYNIMISIMDYRYYIETDLYSYL